MEIIDVTGMEPGEILWQRQFVMVPDHFTQVCALVTTAKGPSGNKVCILARAPGGLAVLLAPYIPQRVCSSLAPCQRARGPAAKCTPYFLTGPKASGRVNNLVWGRL